MGRPGSGAGSVWRREARGRRVDDSLFCGRFGQHPVLTFGGPLQYFEGSALPVSGKPALHIDTEWILGEIPLG